MLDTHTHTHYTCYVSKTLIRPLFYRVGLKPIYFRDTKILFIGSFASSNSSNINKHYGCANNLFWGHIKTIFGDDDIPEKDYCSKYHIGLVDVVKECWMPEKSNNDSEIHDPKYVNIVKIISTLEQLKLIVVQGDFAWNYFCEKAAKRIARNLLIIKIDSTSGINRQRDRINESFKFIKKLKEKVL